MLPSVSRRLSPAVPDKMARGMEDGLFDLQSTEATRREVMPRV